MEYNFTSCTVVCPPAARLRSYEEARPPGRSATPELQLKRCVHTLLTAADAIGQPLNGLPMFQNEMPG